MYGNIELVKDYHPHMSKIKLLPSIVSMLSCFEYEKK